MAKIFGIFNSAQSKKEETSFEKGRRLCDLLVSSAWNGEKQASAIQLIEAGADLTIFKDGWGVAPAIANSWGRMDLFKMMILKGADINQKCGFRDDTYPLWFGLLRRPEMLPFMLEQGANSRARDNQGNTALHWFLKMKFSWHEEFKQADTQFIQDLIDAGVEVGACNQAGQSALDLLRATIPEVDTVLTILEAGAHLDWQTREGASLRDTLSRRPGLAAAIIMHEAVKKLPVHTVPRKPRLLEI